MVDAGSSAEGQSGLSPGGKPGDVQMAQATVAGAQSDAIGSVNEATGDAFIVHKDGTSQPAAVGTPVYADDIVATGTDGAVEVVFKDGTTFSLGHNGQMRLDSLIYDPAGTNNGLDATIVKGSFVFITGHVGSAQGEGVSIDTPAGTIGIRGTSGGVVQDPQTGSWTFTLFRDPDGKLSHFTVTNPAGEQLLDQEFETTEVAGFHTRPSQTITLSPAQASALFSDALHLLSKEFPELQRSELENVNPAAGDQFGIRPGHLPPSAESLGAMFGLGALSETLAELLGNDPGQSPELGPLEGQPSTHVPPVFTSTIELPPQTNTVTEDATPDSASGGVLPDNGTLTVIAVDGSADNVGHTIEGVYGTLQLNADGSYVYTLNNLDPDVQALGEGQTANDVFSYTVTDGHGHKGTATLTITVTGTNDPPQAVDDANAVPDDTASVSGNVLANDTDIDKGDTLAVIAVNGSDTAVGHTIDGIYGTLQLNADGSYSYAADNGKSAFQALGAGQTADDSFSYTVSDGHGGTSTATLTVTVTGVNDAPVAVDDDATTAEDTPVTIAVLANDTDADGNHLTVSQASALHGTVVINDDGTLTYTPNANYNGPDTISYTANDGTADSNVATVAVTVTPVNDPPVAVDDAPVTTAEDKSVIVTVLTNDTDADGDPLTVSHAAALHGTVAINDDGTLTYTPNANYNGPDTISYTANDGTADSNVATVAVTVTPVNDPPVAVDDQATTAEDTPVTIAVLTNDSDVDGDPLTVSHASALHGAVVINDDGTLTYTPNANYNGPDTISYTANDGTVDSNVATVAITVTPVNDPPVAVDDASVTTAEDTPITVTVLTNDTDPDGDSLTVSHASALHGTVTINDDGTLTYTPNANYNGPDTISYTANDGTADSNVATVAVTVTSVNDPPVAVDDQATTAEDIPVTIAVLTNDSDVDGDPLTVSHASALHGTVAINDDGTLTYTPNANYNGPDTISYTANDGTADSNVATVAITVAPVNDPPVAVDDAPVTTAEDTPVVVTVLTNDTDPDGDPLTVGHASALHGTVAINDNGTLTYTPNANYNGPDTISYTANDGTVDSNVATVAVTVTPVNDPPVAVNDAPVTTAEDKSVIVTVLANDTDVDGDPLTVSHASALHGTVAINDDGTLTYTPNANYNGPDTISYTSNDGTADSNVATVAVTVTPVNDAPVAVNDQATTAEDTPVTIAVLTNDTDVDGDPLTVSHASALHGTVAINDDGTLTYTPNANYNGPDTISYTANDGAADSNVATVAVTVTPVNDPPVAVDDQATTAEDTPVTIAVLANDTDVDGDPLTVSHASALHGTVAINDDGTLTYTPNANYNGPDTISYTANDGTADSNVATVAVTVTPVNDTPVAVNDQATTAEDTPVTIAVLTNDTDADGDPLTVSHASALHGTVAINDDGTLTYTPNANYNGPDTISYTANDGTVDSNVATVAVTVTPVNDPPVAVDDKATTAEDTPVTIAVLTNDSDVDGDPLTVSHASALHGTVAINDDGTLTYTPNANYNGPDTISYTANDGIVDSNVATVAVTVTPVNDPPVAVDDAPMTTAEDTSVTVTVLTNDTDPDGDALTVSHASALHGIVAINDDGTLTYTPNANYNGPDTISYTANDGTVDSNVATVAITVTPVNDPPVAVDDKATTAEDTPVTIAVLTNDSDVDGDPLTVSHASALHGTVAINDDGTLTYTPNANYNGPDTISYTANDGTVDSNVATVAITVTPVNDPPVAVADSYSTDEDTKLTVAAAGVLANDKDVDSTDLSALLVSGPSHGTLALNGDGSFSYTPDENYNGADSFTYKANDGSADSNLATVTLTVNPVNDAPVAVADGPFTTAENTALSIPLSTLLANDSDVDGDALQITGVKAVSGGTVSIEGDHVLFTPDSRFDGLASFDYTISDGHGGTATAAVSVNVVDSKPDAVDDSVKVADTAHKTVDLVIILDRSGSMDDPSGVPGVSTRLELARAAIAALFEAYQSVANVHIQVVDFSDNAASSGWLSSPEAANAYLASLTAGGGTNYTAAIDTAMAAYAGAPTADKSEVYFLSDGAPTAGEGLSADKTTQWEGFLTANKIDTAFAVGIGELANPTAAEAALAPIAYPNGDDQNPIIVTQPAELVDTLVGTVVNPVSGNVLANDDFGVDGKGNNGSGLQSITIDGVTYDFDGTKIVNEATQAVIAGATLVEHTLLGGLLEFHFDTGAYTYTPPDVSADKAENFTYTIVDGDGSTASATLQIDITDSGISVIDPSVIFGADNSKAPNDNISGTAGDDIMSGGAGNDTVSGLGGNDHIQGGAGNDALLGGAGIDVLIGGAGNDSLDGGGGGDVLVGGDGDDRITVRTGDHADGGAGNDTFILLDNTGFGSIQGGDTAAVNVASSGGDVLAFNGELDITKLAADRIQGIETISMAESVSGGAAGSADKLTINAQDVIDLGAGHLDPNGKFGEFGELTDAPAIRVNGDGGDGGDSLTLAGGGWQQVTSTVTGLPSGYILYVHDSPAAGSAADAYVLVQTAVKVTTG